MTEKDEIKEEKKDDKKEEKPKPVDKLVESKHSVTIGGRELKYTVLTGTIVMKEETPDREKSSKLRNPVRRSSLSLIPKTMRMTNLNAPSPFRSTADPAPRLHGCTLGCSARAAWSCRRMAACRLRPSS